MLARWAISFLTMLCLSVLEQGIVRGQGNRMNPHYPYKIPTLHEYPPKSTEPDPTLPFNQLTAPEQAAELDWLIKLDKAARTVVGVYPKYMELQGKRVEFTPQSPQEAYFAEHMSRSLVVTVANMGYLSHLRNFACFAQRLQMHFLVLAVDDLLVEALSTAHHPSFTVLRYPGHYTAQTYNSTTPPSEEAAGLAKAAGFQSAQFNLISLRKFEAVYDLQRLGYDVLFVDADVVVLQDVFPLFLKKHLHHVAYMHSMNQICSWSGEDPRYFLRSTRIQPNDGNTGFHFLQHPGYALQRLDHFYRSHFTGGGGGGGFDDVYGVPRPAPEQRTRAFYRQLLQVTETLPTLQLLFHFLRHVPHDAHFNPNGQFDDQTLFWRFLRALRWEQNGNIPPLLQALDRAAAAASPKPPLLPPQTPMRRHLRGADDATAADAAAFNATRAASDDKLRNDARDKRDALAAWKHRDAAANAAATASAAAQLVGGDDLVADGVEEDHYYYAAPAADVDPATDAAAHDAETFEYHETDAYDGYDGYAADAYEEELDAADVAALGDANVGDADGDADGEADGDGEAEAPRDRDRDAAQRSAATADASAAAQATLLDEAAGGEDDHALVYHDAQRALPHAHGPDVGASAGDGRDEAAAAVPRVHSKHRLRGEGGEGGMQDDLLAVEDGRAATLLQLSSAAPPLATAEDAAPAAAAEQSSTAGGRGHRGHHADYATINKRYRDGGRVERAVAEDSSPFFVHQGDTAAGEDARGREDAALDVRDKRDAPVGGGAGAGGEGHRGAPGGGHAAATATHATTHAAPAASDDDNVLDTLLLLAVHADRNETTGGRRGGRRRGRRSLLSTLPPPPPQQPPSPLGRGPANPPRYRPRHVRGVPVQPPPGGASSLPGAHPQPQSYFQRKFAHPAAAVAPPLTSSPPPPPPPPPLPPAVDAASHGDRLHNPPKTKTDATGRGAMGSLLAPLLNTFLGPATPPPPPPAPPSQVRRPAPRVQRVPPGDVVLGTASEELFASHLLLASTGACAKTTPPPARRPARAAPLNASSAAAADEVAGDGYAAFFPAPGEAAVQLCALNNCQVAPAAFLHFAELVKQSVKRLKREFPALQFAGAPVQTAVAAHSSAHGRLTPPPPPPSSLPKRRLDDAVAADADGRDSTADAADGAPSEAVAPHALPTTPGGLRAQMLQLLSFPDVHAAGNAAAEAPETPTRRRNYWYALHGNYVTGEAEKWQLMQQAGFWLVPNATASAASASPTQRRLDFTQCLAFPHRMAPAAAAP